MKWLVVVIMLSGSALADDAKQKSSTCVACHGQEGHSANPLWPNLAGQKEQYIIEQLKAFRDGTRVNPMMSGVAKMLSDQDINDLAAYFSKL